MAVHPGRALKDIFEPSEPVNLNKLAELDFLDYNLIEELIKKTGLKKPDLQKLLKTLQKTGAVSSEDWGEGKLSMNILDPSSLDKIPDQVVDSFISWSAIDKDVKGRLWSTLLTSEHSPIRLTTQDTVTGGTKAYVADSAVGWASARSTLGPVEELEFELGSLYGDMSGQVKKWLQDKDNKDDFGKFQDTRLAILDKICERHSVSFTNSEGQVVDLRTHLDSVRQAKKVVTTAKGAEKKVKKDSVLAFGAHVEAEVTVEKAEKELGKVRKAVWEETEKFGDFFDHLPADAKEEFYVLHRLRLLVEGHQSRRDFEDKLAVFGVAKSFYDDGLSMKNLKATWKWMGKIAPGSVGKFQKWVKTSSAPIAKITRKVNRLYNIPKELSVSALKSVNYFGFSAKLLKNRALLHGDIALEAVGKLGSTTGKLGRFGLDQLRLLAGGKGREVTYIQHLYNYANNIGTTPAHIVGALNRKEARVLMGQLGGAFFGKKDWGTAQNAFRKSKGLILVGETLRKVTDKFKGKISILDVAAKLKDKVGKVGAALQKKAVDLAIKAAVKVGTKLGIKGVEKVATKAIALVLAPETLGLSVVLERLLVWVILPLIKKLFGWLWNTVFKGVWNATLGKIFNALKGNKVVKVVVKTAAVTMLAPIITVVGTVVVLPFTSILVALGGCLLGTIGLALLVFVVIIGASSGLPTTLGHGGSEYFAQIPPPEQGGYIPPSAGPIVVTVTPTPSILEESFGTINYVVAVANNTEEAVTVDLEDSAFLVTAEDVVIPSGNSVSVPGWGSFVNVPVDYMSSCPELGVNKFCNKVTVTLSDGGAVIGWGMGQVLFNSALADYPSGWPLTARHCITTGTDTPLYHINTSKQSVDFSIGPSNADVVATHNGIVSTAGYSSVGYGNLVVVSGLDGSFESYYAHLVTISVSVGDTVTVGTKLGVEGNTGNSFGTHLHYEFRGSGIFMGPPYLPWAVPPCSGYLTSNDSGYSSCLEVLGANACIN